MTLQRGNTYKGALLGQPGPVLLGLGAIERDGGFKDTKLKTYGGSSDPRMLLSPGDVFVSLKDVTQAGDLLGSVARLPAHISTGRLTQDTVKLVPKHDAVPLDLIYWTLRTPQYRAFCRAHATGTTNLGLARDDFLSFPIPLLCDERSNLVGLLQSVDDKIELNRKLNATLEAMARALFRDWFVDFGPTRAKMEARAPYLSPDLWSLFPDRLDAEGKPEGWELGEMSDLFTLQRGFDLPSQDRRDGAYPILAASGPSGFHETHMVKGPGVTTGRSGVLGRVFYVQGDFWPLNTSLWVKDYKRATPLYAYYFLRLIDLAGFNAGSAVPTLNRNHIHGLPAVLAPRELIAAFDRLADSLMMRHRQNEIENETLARTRDLLLPRLMSGELQVADLPPSEQEAVA